MPSEPTPTSSLRRMILQQSVSGTAVPMLLFSDETLAAADASHGDVERVAASLDIDLGELDLFSYDAYRLQSALGEGLAP